MIGLPGEAIMEPIDLAMDGIFTFWFFAKCGFGGPSILQLVDDLLELVGVPGRTICVVAGILIANNPKLAKIAELAATAETGGAGAGLKAGRPPRPERPSRKKRRPRLKKRPRASRRQPRLASWKPVVKGKLPKGLVVGSEFLPKMKELLSRKGLGNGEREERKRRILNARWKPRKSGLPKKLLRKRFSSKYSKNGEGRNEEGEEENEGESVEQAGQGRESSDAAPGDEPQKRAEEIRRKQQQLPKMIDVNEENKG